MALNICVEGAYPPFSETAEDGSVVGFDIDIANALCTEMAVECEMVKTDWDGIIPALLERKCDAIVASMSITPERSQVIDFTHKYYNTPARLIAPEGTDLVDSPEGMAGKRIGVQRGSVHHGYVEAAYPDADLVLYGTQDEANLDLLAGRVDAVMADSVVLDLGFLQTPDGEDFAFFGEPHLDPKYHGDGVGIGIRKGEDELREDLNGAIAAIRDSGKYDEIASEYFEFDIYGE
ncbi:transporter substrate-binding domain-containing protein [Amaricoccus macauensis]|uniref:transporter substrate-binding domain-containing protein n=1 Tax=Amaricoccus macauensis TaxID=57001 RepID=UPI003C7BAC44